MTTVREICTRAIKRLNIVDVLETPTAQDMVSALDMLNEMMWGWHSNGVNTLMQADWALDDTFAFFVPPLELEASTISALSYRGTWNASTNSPALATSVGTAGYAYKVSDAGSTTLDDVTSWAVNDYAVFDGLKWLKSIDSTRLHGAVVANLALRLGEEFAKEPTQRLVASAADGWFTLHGYYVKPPKAGFDSALISMPSRTAATSFDEL